MHGHKKVSQLPICFFVALLLAHPILHVSSLGVNLVSAAEYIRKF